MLSCTAWTRGGLMQNSHTRRGPHLLSVAVEAFTVSDYATSDIWKAPPSMEVQAAKAFMDSHDFDVAPIADERVWRYVNVAHLAEAHGRLDDAARPINVAEVVPGTSSLADSVERLKTAEHLFVMSRAAGVDAVVTRADLQRPAVAMVALALTLAAEAALTQLIRENYDATGWRVHLSKERLAKAEEVLADRQRHNAELELLDCIMLDDRLTLVRKHRGLIEGLGLASAKQARRWFATLSDCRDVLAHAGSLLSVADTPQAAIEIFAEVRRFAESAWKLVRNVPWHWADERLT